MSEVSEQCKRVAQYSCTVFWLIWTTVPHDSHFGPFDSRGRAKKNTCYSSQNTMSDSWMTELTHITRNWGKQNAAFYNLIFLSNSINNGQASIGQKSWECGRDAKENKRNTSMGPLEPIKLGMRQTMHFQSSRSWTSFCVPPRMEQLSNSYACKVREGGWKGEGNKVI